jgi:hypothetical protein
VQFGGELTFLASLEDGTISNNAPKTDTKNAFINCPF